MKMATLTGILLTFIILFNIGYSLAQYQIPGIEENDYFIYKISAYWSSENSTKTVPGDLLEYNNTLNYEVDITSISGPNVTSTETWRFQDSTENQVIVVQNVDTGQLYVMKGLSKMIGANLGSGDAVYPSGNETWSVNQTETKDYGGTKREINVIAFIDEAAESNGSISASSRTDYLFDKETGMLVEQRDDFQSSEENVSIVMTLTETNRWSITQNSGYQIEFSLPLQIAVVIIVAVLISVVGIYVYHKSKIKSKKRRR